MRLGSLVALAACGLATAGAVQAADKSSSRPNVIAVPSGPGSVAGLGESYEANLNAGSARQTVKLEVPPGTAGFQPSLALTYDSGSGNGPLGIGWTLSQSRIQVQTEKGLPRYDGTDRYLLDGAELVELGGGVYRLKNEGRFVRARRSGDHWEVDLPDGRTLRYGVTAEGRLADGARTFAWVLEEELDRFGNRIGWFHEQDGGQPYLAEIQYDRRAGAADDRILFEYEARPDALTDCRPRFCVTAGRRLRQVSMYASGKLVRRYVLTYGESNGFSLLASVTQVGSDGVTALPPLRFWYSPFTPAGEPVAMSSPSTDVPGPGAANDELVDVDGDGYPDLLHAEAGRHRYSLNEGGKRFGARIDMASSPSVSLSVNGVEIADLNGDGIADLVARTGTTASSFRYFPGSGNGWQASVPFSSSPSFGLEDPSVKLLDFDGDKLIDVARLGTGGFTLWRNAGDGTWEGPITAPSPSGGTSLSFTDPHVRLADMNGDRLLDLVYVRSGSVTWWPSMGWGSFGEPLDVPGAPAPGTALEGSLLLADVNGDGLSDLVLVDTDHVEVWPLLPSGAYGERTVIEGTPHRNTTVTAVRLADLNGNGSTDIAWVTPTADPSERIVYLDLVGDSKPNLLTAVENGLGKTIQLTYTTSGAQYQEARDAGNPWSTRVPFPVQVVSSARVMDGLGHASVTGYAYRDGWYAAATREFRGFARAIVTEVGDENEATAITVHEFDLGASAEARKGLPLSMEVRTEGGALLRRDVNTYQDRVYARGVDGTPIAGANRVRQEVEHWEGTAAPAVTREEWTWDDHGNVLVHSEWGVVENGDPLARKDERITTSTFANDTGSWLLGRVTGSTIADAAGKVVAATRSYYDGEAFAGLPLGRLGDAGALTRSEAWVEGDHWAQTERVQRDEFGIVVATLDPLGTLREIDYDPATHRFPVAERIHHGAGKVLAFAADYDLAQGLLVSYRDQAGRETAFSWDALHRLTGLAKPGDSLELPTQAFEYTLGNPLSAVRTLSRVTVGKAEVVEERAWYDGLGRALGVVEQAEQGKTVASGLTEYGSRGHAVRAYEAAFTTGYALPTPAAPFTSHRYDALGRVVRSVLPDGAPNESRYGPLVVERWDAEDLDPASPHTATPRKERLSGLGLAEVEERLGAAALVTRYGWDAGGKLVSVTDALGNLTSWTLDGLGRIRELADADTGVVSFDLDDAGHVLHRVDARGAVVEAGYDALGRPAQVRLLDPAGAEEERVVYHYDDASPLFPGDVATGVLSWVEDGAGEEHQRHDERGRVVESVRKVDGVSYRLAQDLDEEDRVVGLTYPDGRRLELRRTERGLLAQVPGVIQQIEYEASGRFTRREHANGAVTTASYDDVHRTKSLGTVSNGSPLQSLTYEYDRVGNLETISDAVHMGGPLSSARTAGYDDLYRLVKVDSPDRSWSYAYNAVGDMTSKSDVGEYTLAKAHLLVQAGDRSFTYDEAGNMATRLGAKLGFDAKERLSRVELDDGTVITYRYDYAGHRVVKRSSGPGGVHQTVYAGEVYEQRDGEGVAYVVEGRTRLAKLDGLGGSARASGGFIGRGSRPGGPDVLLILATAVLAALASRRRMLPALACGAAAACLIGIGLAACGGGGSGTSATPIAAVHYHGDHLGSTSLLTDEAGAVVAQITYDAWGQELVTADEPYTFTGKEYERDTGLYDFAARAYDPVIGRFISADPIAETQFDGRIYDSGTGLPDYGGRRNWPQVGRFVTADGQGNNANPAIVDRYAYALNSPYSYVDPTGHAPRYTEQQLREMLDFDRVEREMNAPGPLQLAADSATAWYAQQSLDRGTPGLARACAAVVGAITGLFDSENYSRTVLILSVRPRGNARPKARFISQPDGTLVDTTATPPGSYDHPGVPVANGTARNRTDVLQVGDHGAGHSHTHEPVLRTNAQGETFITGTTQGRPVSAEDIRNIQTGTATKTAPKGR